MSCITPFATAIALLAVSGVGADDQRIAALQYPVHKSAAVPYWLPGVWSREWIERQGIRSSTHDVHYLQTPTFFGDVRIPIDRPKFARAGSFADLTDQDLRALAKQHGFAGNTTVRGGIATWDHQIDFQPPDGTDDVGRIQSIPNGRMYEHGLDASYLESWKSLTDGEGRFLVIRTELAGRAQRILLVAGDHFLYVRNRAKDLPTADSLDALIDATGAPRSQIIEYLDCEFSAGRAHNGSILWEIQHSTLPWREGHHLEFVDEIDTSQIRNGIRPHRAELERWTVPVNTLTPAQLTALLGGRRR